MSRPNRRADTGTVTTPHEADRDLSAQSTRARIANLEQWLLGLPWVFEHAVPDVPTSVRLYAIGCDLLPRRCIWAVTGLTHDSPTGLCLVVPLLHVHAWHRSGWAQPVLRLPADDALVSVAASIDDPGTERLALSAYAHAFERAADGTQYM